MDYGRGELDYMIIERLLDNDFFFQIVKIGLTYYPLYLVLLLFYQFVVKIKALEIVVFIYTIIELISAYTISTICLQATITAIKNSDQERVIILLPFLIFFFAELGMILVLKNIMKRWIIRKETI